MDHAEPLLDSQISAVRRFGRFYTRKIGVLEEGLLKSEFSLTEARVLYELANGHSLAASDLVRDLGLDAGYVSRILKKFEERGLVTRNISSADARQSLLVLTENGEAAFRPLDRTSHDEVAGMLEKLDERDRAEIVCAMETIQHLLEGRRAVEPAVVLREILPGDIGWIAHRQMILYRHEYGWDATYEALVAEILASFVKNNDPKVERAWIAERDGEIVGSVFLVRKSAEVAKLRLLYVEPSARGFGIGRKLVAECIAFARACGYQTMTLWTNDCLHAARHIYETAGFRLVAEESHHSFGKDLVGQDWELEL